MFACSIHEAKLLRAVRGVTSGATLCSATMKARYCTPGSTTGWVSGWIYDCRTNKEFTLKERRLVRADLDEFVERYHPENRHQRKATWDERKNPEGRWRGFTYEEIVARDKCSLDIFWLKDVSLEDSSKLPDPHVLAAEIAEDLRGALEQIESVLGDLRQPVAPTNRGLNTTNVSNEGASAYRLQAGHNVLAVCRRSPTEVPTPRRSALK